MIKNLRLNYLTPLIFSILIFPSNGFSQEGFGCKQFRTQTQGGWGTQASGNNPGSYRDAHFEAAFPNGIVIGCMHTLSFSTSANVAAFLPSGSSARVLTESLVNPTSYNNVLAGQLLALTLSVGFDNADPDFSPSETLLSQQIINSGTFEGMSVGQVLIIANELIGGCVSEYSPSEVNAVLSGINENYVDGSTNGGFLDCPEAALNCELSLDGISTHCSDDGTYTLLATLSGANGAFEVVSETAISGNGTTICFGNPADDNSINQLEIALTFPLGDDYDFEIVQYDNPSCTSATTFNCSVAETTGPAPECCSLNITCETLEQYTFTCISDIPAANPDGVTYSSTCGEVSIGVNETSQGGGCASSPYVLVRTYTVTNGTDIESCTHTFEVVDNEAPVLECPPAQTASCDSSIVPDIYATATDNCSTDIYISYTDGLTGSCSEFTRTWVAMDNCGNIGYCYQTVYIDDQTPPVLSVPEDVIVDCGTNISPEWIGIASATDYCSDVYITFEDAEPIGEGCSQSITRTWIATDACGNATSADQNIIQTDLTGPSILGVPPGNTIQCGEIAPAPEVFAIDNCQLDTLDVTMEENISINGCRTVISRTYTAIDNCGNISTLYRNHTIEDTEGPEMTCPSDVMLACGDEETEPGSTGVAEAFDNCSGTFVTITFEDGDMEMNACPPGFKRFWAAIDTCGNVSNCVQEIRYDDQVAPEISCLDPITIDCADANTSPEFTGTPIATDACSDVILDFSDGSLNGDCPATFIRTWSATDACGNTSYCYQDITVIDNEAPILTCPSDITVSCAYKNAPTYATGMATATDQCLDVYLTYEDGEIIGDCEKSMVRTWIASDQCGNTSTCEQNIYFEDAMLPVVFCPNDTIVACGSDISPESTGTATAVDFCSDVSVSHTDADLPNACPGGIARTWTATDACGNTKSCVQTILFEDGALPEIACPADITVTCGSDTDPMITGSPSVVEGCTAISVTYTDSLVITETTGTNEGCGQLRTQTQGGWGTRASGNNPGTYRDAHFADAFPNGLVVGCDFTLTLTSSAAVQAFLPNGGPIRSLTENLVNPTNFRTVFAGQLVAATLSLGFDAADPDFGTADIGLAGMIIQNGEFAGQTVAEVVAIANAYFGGCETSVSGSALNSVLTGINENYVDGNQNHGFLDCPETTGGGDGDSDCGIIYRTWTATDACGNTAICTQTITMEGDENSGILPFTDGILAYPSPTTGNVTLALKDISTETQIIQVMDISGAVRLTQTAQAENQNPIIDLSSLESGTYMIKVIQGNTVHTSRIVKL